MNPIEVIIKEKIFAVLRINNPIQTIEVAKSLIEGGIKIIEVVVQSASHIDVVRHLSANPDVIISAGGIITQKQATASIEAGAKIIVSPVFQMNLVRLCKDKNIPILMTATTPNEAYEAWKARIPLIKIYPVKQMGGAKYIEDLLRPMQFLNVIATGSISFDDFTDYLDAGARAVGIGRAFYQDATNEEIIQRAKFVIKKRDNK